MVADAGPAGELAWLGAGLAALLLATGMLAASPAPVHAAVAVLAATFLARQDTRLLLAPAFGAGLLVMDDLAIRMIELRGVDRIVRGTAGTGIGIGATLLVAAVGACASAAAALAVNVAPGRSVWMTALGAVAAVTAFAGIARLARRRFRSGAEEQPSVSSPGGA